MVPKEVDYIINSLTKSDTMIEYGAGYSTNHFSPYVNKYYSIEHNNVWFDKINNDKNSNVEMHLSSVPTLGHCDYDAPTDKDLWRDYYTYADNLNIDSFDKVLIDGRARAYCALNIKKYLHSESLVFIHDWPFRSKYHSIVESVYKQVDLIHHLFVGVVK